MPDALRLLFFGTPEFAVPSLRALAESRHEVVGVVSQPDRPRGRGRKAQPTPVSAEAERLGLDVLQPEKVGQADALAWMADRGADLGCVVAFGQFIPLSVRRLPAHRLINAHASLLPRWRGAAPIEHALLAGDTHTGITIIRVAKEMDAGDWCLMREIEIGADETAGELSERLARMAAACLVEASDSIADGTASFCSQPEDGVELAPKLSRAFGRIDPAETAERMARRIRAATPRPGARLALARDGRELRVLRARVAHGAGASRAGAVRVEDGRLLVGALDGWVEILRLQAPGKRPASAEEFLRGARLAPDEEVSDS